VADPTKVAPAAPPAVMPDCPAPIATEALTSESALAWTVACTPPELTAAVADTSDAADTPAVIPDCPAPIATEALTSDSALA